MIPVIPVEIKFSCLTGSCTGEPLLKGQRILLFSLTTCKNEHNQINAIRGQKVTMQPYKQKGTNVLAPSAAWLSAPIIGLHDNSTLVNHVPPEGR